MLEYLFRVRVENVRAVLVYQDAGVVVVVESISADMRALVHQQHFLVAYFRQAFSDYTTRKPGTYNQVIKHLFSCLELPRGTTGDLCIGFRFVRAITAAGGDRGIDQRMHLRPGAVPRIA